MHIHVNLLIISGLLAAPFFLVLMFLFGALEPGYSHLERPMSVLGGVSGLRGALFNAGVVVTGGLVAIFSYALHRQLPPGGMTSIAYALLGLGGVGLMGAGIFHCTPECENILKQPNLVGRIHIVTSLVAGAGAGSALFFYAWVMHKSRELSRLVMPTWFAAVLANVPGILYWFGFATGSQVYFLGGLIERLGLVVTLLWMFYVALTVYRGKINAKVNAA